MSYQFGSFPASTGLTTSIPSFGGSYDFSGFNSGFASATPIVSAPSPFTSSFGAVSAPTVFSPGYSTAGFGAAPVFSGTSLGATTLGGFGGLYSAGVTAPTAFSSYNAIPSGFQAPTVFGGFPTAAQFGGFQTPNGLAQNAFLAQAQQQGVDGARSRQVSKIEYGLGVPTMIPASGNEEKLERTPSGNLPRREASRGELRTRSFSGQPTLPVQGAPNSMAAYLAQNSSLGAGRAQAVAASTMSSRNLGSPTGHRGSNPREQVPW